MGVQPMNLPKLDISVLPDLDKLTGVFGSVLHPAQAVYSDDTIIILMAFLYEILPPGGHF
jgi:hypothetical protein